MGLRSRLAALLIGDELKRLNLSVRALDDAHDRLLTSSRTDTQGTRDRYGYDRQEVLADALEAWRSNPLARRIVGLTSDYVVGGGLSLHCDHQPTNEFLQAWFEDDLNRLLTRSYEWCDELTRSGELFIVISTDAAGLSYVRAIPASEIEDITTRPNDVEQAISYQQKPLSMGDDPITWPAYNKQADDPAVPVMRHYCINRPVGAKFGESDLGPLLKWLLRYSDWLENRARLNKFRNLFMWVVKRFFASDGERSAYEKTLNAAPPNSGSILVINKDEEWSAVAPNLESGDAGKDGEALKKMIAAGSANPMHFFAEPEGATRTTAEQSGGPTFRHYSRRQIYFLWMMADLASIAIRRRAQFDNRVDANAKPVATGTDISTRDNTELAQAAAEIVTALIQLHDRHLLTDEELVRMAYRFAGEIVDVKDLLEKARKQPWPKTSTQPTTPPNNAPPSPAAVV